MPTTQVEALTGRYGDMRIGGWPPFLLLGLAGATLFGCAGSAPPSLTHETIAQQDMDRKKTQAPPSDPPGSSLPTLDRDDAEWAGDNYVRQGALILAFAKYDKLLRSHPDDVRVRYKRGLLYLGNGLAAEAAEDFQRILAQDQSQAPALDGLGRSYLQLGRLPEAQDCFERATRLNPRLWRSQARLGILHDSQGRHAEAADSFRAALAVKPGHQALLNNLGRALYLMGRYEEAVDHFRRALQAGPPQPQLGNNLALALAKLGRYQDAFDAFHTYAGPRTAYNNLGVAYWAAGQYRAASACFSKALQDTAGHRDKPAINLAALKEQVPEIDQPKSGPGKAGGYGLVQSSHVTAPASIAFPCSSALP